MANKRRGEFEATIGGRKVVFRLTMGALAELEDASSGKSFVNFIMEAAVETSARRLTDAFCTLARLQHPTDADALIDAFKGGTLTEAAGFWTGLLRAAELIEAAPAGGDRPLAST